MVYNIFFIILKIFLLIIYVLQIPVASSGGTKFGQKLFMSYQMTAISIWALLSSLWMFHMSLRNKFHLKMSSDLCLKLPKSIKLFSMLMVILELIIYLTISSISIYYSLIFYDMSPIQAEDVYGSFKLGIITLILGNVLFLPGFILPLYLSTYAYVIGKQFSQFSEDLENCPKLFEKRDSVIER